MKVIFGASGGLGKYLYEYYLEKEDCVGTYNKNKIFDDLLKCDVTSSADCANFFKCLPNHDNITVINATGYSYNAFLHKSDPDKWSSAIDINIKGCFNIIQSAILYMKNNEGGNIINLSSIVGQISVPGTSSYAASKSALTALTRTAAAENARNNIFINNLNLGYFDRGMIELIPSSARDEIIKSIPFRKLGDPKEIVRAVQWLENSEYVTGTCIDINGGLY